MAVQIPPQGGTPRETVEPAVVTLARNHPLCWTQLKVRYGLKRMSAESVMRAVGLRVERREFGQELATAGLAMVHVPDDVLVLRQARPELAEVVNESRYGWRPRGRMRSELIDIALGDTCRDMSDEDRLLRAARVYITLNTWGIRLIYPEPIYLRSPWRFVAGGDIVRERFKA